MIQKDNQSGEFELICDHCEEVKAVRDTWAEARDAKKDLHFKSIQGKSGTWYEVCSECQSEETFQKYRNS